MNPRARLRAKVTAEHVERLRVTGAAYLNNQTDFSRVVLDYGHALLKARAACGDDDTAFGSWLAAHRLEHVPKNDRAALIALAKHAKIAAKVLRATTSRSVRLIWENEVRPKAYPMTYPSVGTDRQTITVQVRTIEHEIKAPVYVRKQAEPEQAVDAEHSDATNLTPKAPYPRFAKYLAKDLISITATLALLGPNGREAVLNQMRATCSTAVIGDALDFVAELRSRLTASQEPSPADADANAPTAKLLH